MKNFITIFLIISLMTYLAGSFIWASFDLTLWDESGRCILGSVSFGIIMLSGMIIGIQATKENEK